MAGPVRRKSIGQLRHRVTIQAAAETADDFGQMSQDWTDEATVWGRVEPFNAPGSEPFVAGQVQARATHIVTLRRRAGLTPKKRFVWQADAATAVTLNIVTVYEQAGDANYLECWCVRQES